MIEAHSRTVAARLSEVYSALLANQGTATELAAVGAPLLWSIAMGAGRRMTVLVHGNAGVEVSDGMSLDPGIGDQVVMIQTSETTLDQGLSGRVSWLMLLAMGEASIEGPTSSVLRTMASFPPVFARYQLASDSGPLHLPDCAFFRGLNAHATSAITDRLPARIRTGAFDQMLVVALALITLPRTETRAMIAKIERRMASGRMQADRGTELWNALAIVAQASTAELYGHIERGPSWPHVV